MTAELDTANSVCIDALNQLNSAIRAFSDIKPIKVKIYDNYHRDQTTDILKNSDDLDLVLETCKKIGDADYFEYINLCKTELNLSDADILEIARDNIEAIAEFSVFKQIADDYISN